MSLLWGCSYEYIAITGFLKWDKNLIYWLTCKRSCSWGWQVVHPMCRYCKERVKTQIQPVMEQVVEFSLSLKELVWKCNSRAAPWSTQQRVDAHEVPSILLKKPSKLPAVCKLLRAATVKSFSKHLFFSLCVRKPNPMTLSMKDYLIFWGKKWKFFF